MTWSSPRRQLLYTRSHLSALISCALIFSTNFQFNFIFKNTLHNLVIELCSALKIIQKYSTVIYYVTRSFAAIELLTFCKNV